MRHLKAGRRLGRTSAHRKALFRNMVTALIDRERIRTTLAKAKELRGKVEKTITLGKKGTLHARRHALKLVADRSSLKKIFGPLSERYANRPGGYTRVIKLGHRLGDDAPMAFIELVDREGDTPSKDKKKVEGATNKKKVADQKKQDKKKDKNLSEAPTAKTTGKKSDSEGKKVAPATKKKTVSAKVESDKKKTTNPKGSTKKKIEK
jgi:large subunit ribosomal protein L17